VLRPLQETGEYKLLGMAYAYGIMDGEAVRKHKVKGTGRYRILYRISNMNAFAFATPTELTSFFPRQESVEL